MAAAAVGGLHAQSPGVEIQAYPAGLIPTVFLEVPTPGSGVFGAYLGYNLTDRRDFGEHVNEEGGGPGAGVAWHRNGAGSGLLAGVRVDLWFLDIDWRDPGPRVGATEITVLQPTVRLGYVWEVGMVAIGALAAFGWEVNLRTVGEDVGQGPIVLVGGRLGRSRE